MKSQKLLNDLIKSIKKGDITKISDALNSGIDVNSTDSNKLSLLHHAAKIGNLETIQLLIDKGASINDRKGDYRVINFAIESGNLEAIKFLINSGANFDASNTHAYCSMASYTPLHHASKVGNIEAIKLFLDLGADIHKQYLPQNEAKTPLHFATKAGHLEAIRLLVSRGANINQPTCEGTPLGMAARSGNIEAMELLIHLGANIYTTFNCNTTALHHAAQKGNLEAMQLLIDKGADVNYNPTSSPLHQSLLKGQTQAAALLINSGAHINESNITTLMSYVAYSGNKDAVNLLLTKVTELGLQDFLKSTDHRILGHALLSQKIEIIDMILPYVNNSYILKNTFELSEIAIEKFSANDFTAIMEMLLNKGMDIHALDHSKKHNFLHYISTNPYWRDCGRTYPVHWDNYDKNHKRRGIEHFKFFVEHGVDINALDEHGRTPLMYVAMKGSPKILKYLIQNGADMNLMDRKGNTSLHLVAERKSDPVLKASIFKHLMDKGARLDIANQEGFTPLDNIMDCSYTGGYSTSTFLDLYAHGVPFDFSHQKLFANLIKQFEPKYKNELDKQLGQILVALILLKECSDTQLTEVTNAINKFAPRLAPNFFEKLTQTKSKLQYLDSLKNGVKFADSAIERIQDETLLNLISNISNQMKLSVKKIETDSLDSMQIVLTRTPVHNLSKIIFSDTPDILNNITSFLKSEDITNFKSVRPAKPKEIQSNSHKRLKIDATQDTADTHSEIAELIDISVNTAGSSDDLSD
ncbi:hypothetical protein phytr_3090 [Candidatus Phycorickettsia trachydisci]|uniref:Uncharacterized protein n=1 Tax=Candidatus Phycorickettsia trachydisci TaxID=2115978 RepID=A0A2P1P7L9_9RICK|nr:ankyrin repeat domain-containing protein [Candidatus Phycorickettsia trachydisci]AVP87263.1 hypothetical protein phytr_3090 [Candidatus Phycorickettsia trachydisci]